MNIMEGMVGGWRVITVLFIPTVTSFAVSREARFHLASNDTLQNGALSGVSDNNQIHGVQLWLFTHRGQIP